MNLCEDGHKEVCYEGRSCPVCDAVAGLTITIEELEQQITDLKDKQNE